jgi:transcriptional regulator with XRE-family HTH domain
MPLLKKAIQHQPIKSTVIDASYQPGRLIDSLLSQLKLKNDAELARFLGVTAPQISKARNRILIVSPGLLLRMHEVTKIPVDTLREMMTVSDGLPAAHPKKRVKRVTPNNLLDTISKVLAVKTDRELAERLQVYPSVISRIRSRKSGVSAEIMIKMHEVSGLSVADLKTLTTNLGLK